MKSLDVSAPCTRDLPIGGSEDRILVVEDDPMFRRILKNWLERWGYRVTIAADGAAAWSILQSPDSPSLLVLDWILPQIDGIELCRMIRMRRTLLYPYILLATSKEDKADIVFGLDAGADDYLIKPFDQDELRARLRVGKRTLALQQELISTRDELKYHATHDALTGAWNRGEILHLLNRELADAQRQSIKVGLLMIDLDHFKRINDTHGHLVGDRVLREVSDRLRASKRKQDSLGRYGGEEFLIIAPHCVHRELDQLANRLREAICATPILAGDAILTVTASIGAVVLCGHSTEHEGLLAADKAMYEAKHIGRNRVVLTTQTA